MPTVLSNNDIVLAQVQCRAGDQIGVCGVHFEASGSVGTGSTIEAFLTLWESNLAADLKALMSNQATYLGVIATRITPNPTSQIGIALLPGAGTVASDLLPTQVAGVITKQTGKPGRSRRGRCYVPFPAEGDNTSGGAPSAGYVTRLAALAADLLPTGGLTVGTGGNTIVMTPIVYSKKHNYLNAVTTYRANQNWGTQRSRGMYGRKNF